MLIERIQIDDGFLDGLEVEFAAGLNVLIGARGTGKTSLIELIRFALNAKTFTQDAERRGTQQALSVLQGGQVTLVLRDGQDRFVVTRGARDTEPRSPRPFSLVTVLAQSEIEAVGAQASGRLLLIDRFVPDREEAGKLRNHLVSVLRSLTAEIGGVRNELDSVSEQIEEMRTVRKDRIIAVERQRELMRSIETTTRDREILTELQNRAVVLGVRSDVYERTTTTLTNLRLELFKIMQRLGQIEDWPDSAGENDLLAGVRGSISEAENTLKIAAEIVQSAEIEVRKLVEQNGRNREMTDEKALKSRQKLDHLRAGAGELARRVEILSEREAQHNALQSLAKDRQIKVAEFQNQRREDYKRLEEVQAGRFASRTRVVNRLNQALQPEIKANVVESGMTNSYANVISAALRGSGLHYNSLAPDLANSMSPLELVEAVESKDVRAITNAVGITEARAINVIAYLQSLSLADLIAAPVEDAVELSLLDGVDYKESDNLSIGQRCTVVLPILFSGHGEPLIIDQPEDHLDNAFITGTLVERLRQRHPGDQFILASHNANIPVLGEADLVVRLGSDGRRGFVQHSGKLDAPSTVKAITSLMEGGVEAFKRRAEFYEHVLGGEVE